MKNADEAGEVQSEVGEPKHDQGTNAMRQFTVDLDRLRDDNYMEVITNSEGWSTLERHFRSLLIVELLDQLRRSGATDKVRDEVIKTLLRNLTSEELQDLRETIETSRFLDTLIVALGDKPS